MQLRPRVARVVAPHGPRARTAAATISTTSTTTQCRIQSALLALANPQYAKGVTRFFKSTYSKGDVFIGVRTPQCRDVVRAHLPVATRTEVVALLHDSRHEMRLAGAICVVEAFTAPLTNAQWLSTPGIHEQHEPAAAVTTDGESTIHSGSEKLRLQQQAVAFYLEHLACLDNWDLVDASCAKVLGAWMLQCHTADMERFCQHVDSATTQSSAYSPTVTTVDVESERAVLVAAMRALPLWYQQLVVSTDFWETRVAVVLLLGIRRQRTDFALHICRWQLLRLLGTSERAYELRIKGERFDDYDLVHKACGWVLRECGKSDRAALVAFLARYAPLLPRTTLQYAAEHLDRAMAKTLASQGRVARKKRPS